MWLQQPLQGFLSQSPERVFLARKTVQSLTYLLNSTKVWFKVNPTAQASASL